MWQVLAKIFERVPVAECKGVLSRHQHSSLQPSMQYSDLRSMRARLDRSVTHAPDGHSTEASAYKARFLMHACQRSTQHLVPEAHNIHPAPAEAQCYNSYHTAASCSLKTLASDRRGCNVHVHESSPPARASLQSWPATASSHSARLLELPLQAHLTTFADLVHQIPLARCAHAHGHHFCGYRHLHKRAWVGILRILRSQRLHP